MKNRPNLCLWQFFPPLSVSAISPGLALSLVTPWPLPFPGLGQGILLVPFGELQELVIGQEKGRLEVTGGL